MVVARMAETKMAMTMTTSQPLALLAAAAARA